MIDGSVSPNSAKLDSDYGLWFEMTCLVARKAHNARRTSRQSGDNTKSEVDARRQELEAREWQGAEVFTWREFMRLIGALVRELDRLARSCGQVDARGAIPQTPDLSALHGKLKEFEDEASFGIECR